MKLSKYNTSCEVDRKFILYNTMSRKYVVFDKEKKSLVDSIFNNLNEKSVEEDSLNELIKCGIVISDNADEFEKLKYLEQRSRFQDHFFHLIIQPTLDCNFRCKYCYENLRKVVIDDDVEEKLLKFINRITQHIKKLQIAWFGGEPMLAIERISDMTRKIKEICEKNNCIYKARMSTNGYLLTDSNIRLLEELSIKSVQITLDGNKETHNKQRPLVNGNGTFEKIKENILKLLEKDILLNLRINVSEDNVKYVSQVYDIIPKDKRKDINLKLHNLFYSKKNINFLPLFMEAIDKGYKFLHTTNRIQPCEVGYKNCLTVEPDGKIVPCSPASEKGFKFGSLDEDGNMNIENVGEYFKFQNTSAMNSKECMDCIQLPMCMGGCKHSRYVNQDVCNKYIPHGLELEDIVKLHYYSDLKHNPQDVIAI